MEKRLNKKLETYILKFKDDIKNKINELNFDDKLKMNGFIEYIYNYEKINLSKEDFMKRKRLKNSIPNINRCSAKRANGEQCTRRRKPDCEFCGTHYKNAPHGLINSEDDIVNKKKTIDIYSEDIKGIIYYIDKFNNVYNVSDIVNGKENPRIIAKYSKNGNEYTIYDL